MPDLPRLSSFRAVVQVERQADLAYTVDFQMVMLERKVARAAGQYTEDEAAELHAKIGASQEQLARTCAEHLLVSTQLKHAEDSLGALSSPMRCIKPVKGSLWGPHLSDTTSRLERLI